MIFPLAEFKEAFMRLAIMDVHKKKSETQADVLFHRNEF